jgi:hypothetical protein
MILFFSFPFRLVSHLAPLQPRHAAASAASSSVAAAPSCALRAPPAVSPPPHAEPCHRVLCAPPVDPHRHLSSLPPRRPTPPSHRAAATAPQPPPHRFSTVHRRRCCPKPPPLSRAIVRHHRGTLGFASPRLLTLSSRARSSQHHGSRQEKGEGTSG